MIHEKNMTSTKKALMRMSWVPENIYNIWQRNSGPLVPMYSFHRSQKSAYQNQMYSKNQLRAYWGGLLFSEKHFKRWYLPANLPVITPGKHSSTILNASSSAVTRYSRPGQDGGRRVLEQAEMSRYHGSQAPLGPFMFRELERRLDHVIFRGGFAKDLKTAKALITGKQVRLNGNIETQRQLRLLPGDFIEINPDTVPWLRPPSPKQVALAQPQSKGYQYNIKDGYEVILRDVVGITNDELIKDLVHNEGKRAQEIVASMIHASPEAREAVEAQVDMGRRELAKPDEDELDDLRGEEAEEAELREIEASDKEALDDEAVDVVPPRGAASPSSSSSSSTTPATSSSHADLPPLNPYLLKEYIHTHATRPPTTPKKLTPTHYPALPTDMPGAREFSLPAYSGPSLFVPGYLQPNWHYCTLVYLRHPTARFNMCEIPSPFNAKGDLLKSAWEWWTARKIRMKTYTGGLMPGGIDARARVKGRGRGPEARRSGVSEDYY